MHAIAQPTAQLCNSNTANHRYWEELLSDWGFGFIASSPSFKRLFGLSLLDQIYNGVYEWTRPLNLTVLRLISFNIEAHQAAKRHESSTPMQEQGGGDKNKTEKGKEDAEDTLAREAVLKDWIDLPPDRAFLSAPLPFQFPLYF